MFLVAKSNIQVGSEGNYLIIVIYVFYIDDNILLIQTTKLKQYPTHNSCDLLCVFSNGNLFRKLKYTFNNNSNNTLFIMHIISLYNTYNSN